MLQKVRFNFSCSPYTVQKRNCAHTSPILKTLDRDVVSISFGGEESNENKPTTPFKIEPSDDFSSATVEVLLRAHGNKPKKDRKTGGYKTAQGEIICKDDEEGKYELYIDNKK